MNGGVIIPLVALSIPIILVPVILGIRHARMERELEHKERMRALELGRRMPGEEPWLTPPMICVSIGAGVPLGVFGIAWLACESLGYRDEIFVFAGLIGIAAVFTGGMLASKHFSMLAQDSANPRRTDDVKPYVDDDAYDVVGSRG